MQKIKKLFIANRGEIVARICRTARRLSIATATVGHRGNEFIHSCVDDVHPVEQESTQLYLDGAFLIDCALKQGCDGLHPGFGFLSENGDFARQVRKAGLIWIGPEPEVIDRMGDKAESRKIAESCQVPCTPGIEQPADQTLDQWIVQVRNFRQQQGYPLLVKAAFGGGGKGMRVVDSDQQLEPALRQAASEARNAFAGDKLIVERFIAAPRHVEVQVLADAHGQTLILGDRDCSVQRRHQKIIEEAPACDLHPEIRREMHEAAKSLAEKVGYSSTGTVEFMVEGSMESGQQSFYFLEMNTRLQVEHPVTEEIFGLDLVEWQLAVAEGCRLTPDLLALKSHGHAVEARIYAEDCLADYLPSPGHIDAFIPGGEGMAGVRWELGITPIDRVSDRFDPMIAKVIAYGANRNESIDRLSNALAQTVLLGPAHNQEFLLDLVRNSQYRHQVVTTNFLKEHYQKIVERIEARRHLLTGWMDGVDPDEDQSVDEHQTMARRAFTRLHKSQNVSIHWQGRTSFCNDFQERFVVYRGLATIDRCESMVVHVIHVANRYTKARILHTSGVSKNLSYVGELERLGAKGAGSGKEVTSPVPGKVIAVSVQEGEEVKAKSTIVIVESMKMEFEVKAHLDGVVAEVLVKEGDQVEADQRLVSWKGDDDDS